ncbi:hypothetical protein ACHAW6_004488, partial [Cyclotella cf. meneghiniana]
LADWLSSNHVCSPKPDKNGTVLNNKNVHFFDDLSRYSQGVGFYSKYFQHCIGNDRVIMDATPEVLMHSERVFDMYQQVDPDLLSNLKSIIVLREPLSKEVSQFLHNTHTGVSSFENSSESIIASPSKIGEYVRHLKTWASIFNRQNVLVLSFDELLQYPSRSQWRVEQFLDKNFQLALESVGVKDEGTPLCSLITLEPYFTRANDELYHFMDSVVGPWMEQHPFPHFVVPTCFAYASVLGWNPDESQNKVYLDAMRVLVQSLRHSIADFIVMMMYHDHEAESLLLSEGATVVHIAPLHHSLDVTYFEPWFVDIALAKLQAFELTKYARVQVLDVDTSVLEAEKMDKLFTSFADSKLVAEGLGSDSPLRAGWFMLQPPEKDFLNIQGILDRGTFTSEHGWDNLDLPLEYPGWKSSHPSRTWEFYGSQLEQGLLFHYFYALPKYNDPKVKDADLLTLLDDNALLSFQFIHFYGEKKPWANNTNAESIPMHIAIAKKKWLNDRDNLISVQRLEESRNHHSLPLTKLGFHKYERARVLYENIIPTQIPSASPTVSPSTSPTSPMRLPSLTPTKSPSTAPTILPMSLSPTTPTTSPSSSPTAIPSISPSASPSASPTVSPSESPTTSPSTSPSVSPSNNPTVSPTASPTGSPSTSPSTSPTSFPSVSPTESPTSSPSMLPTKSPSKSPSSSDSPSVSSSPTSRTTSPSSSPTVIPTISPTSSPSTSPTVSPTESPTTSPSTSPSVSPSNPIAGPTLSPTQSLTASPSFSPSVSPSPRPPLTTINITASFTWNLTCAEYNSTGLLGVVVIVERSIFYGVKSQFTDQTLVFVLVLVLCNENVPNHPPFTEDSRRLVQVDATAVEFILKVEKSCVNCEDEIINATKVALETIVDNGSLQSNITTNSNGTINAFINPGSLILFPNGVPSTSPTKSPSTSPTTLPSTSPTKNPSTSKSASPSASPTVSPTDGRAKNPSTSPTFAVIGTPSPTAKSPSKPPTKPPSSPPTPIPTKSPSTHPSRSPTIPPPTTTYLYLNKNSCRLNAQPQQTPTPGPNNTKASKRPKSQKTPSPTPPPTPKPTIAKAQKSAKTTPNPIPPSPPTTPKPVSPKAEKSAKTSPQSTSPPPPTTPKPVSS